MRSSALNKITAVSFDKDILIVITDNGKYQWNISDVSLRLLNASETDRNHFMISPSGYGIHWPNIEEDLSISGLLKNC
jgi:hypothetical protein